MGLTQLNLNPDDPRGRLGERGFVMTSDRIPRFALVVMGIGVATIFGLGAGCAQPGPIATHRATVGSLKASVSQLEYSNENLRKQVASMQTNATRADNELVQARDARDEMAARLDDAKTALRNNGGDVTALSPSSSGSSSRTSNSSSDDEIPPPARSPVRRSRSTRKPPAAQIPQIFDKARSTLDDADAGPQATNYTDDGRWLPVAHGRSRGSSVELR